MAEEYKVSGDVAEMRKKDGMLTTGLLLVSQIIFVALFSQCTYDPHMGSGLNTQDYVMFIDVSIMIFFGFGYLMTFLRRYGLSATGLCMITSCFAIEISIVAQGIMYSDTGFASMNSHTLLHGLFCAAAIMISMGAVLGKVTPSQLLVMAIPEAILFWVSWYLYYDVLVAYDIGGGVVIHTFGAYFGIACSAWFKFEDHKDMKSIYSSDLFSAAGTFFLWLLWPSFCGAVAPVAPYNPGEPSPQSLATMHTFIALVGSAMGFAIMSRLKNDWQLDAVGLQNATLAGGVVMGVCCDQPFGIWVALLSGLIAGMVSSLGFLTDSTLVLFKVQDVCGVNNLHGMPGLLSALLAIIYFGVEGKYDVGIQLAGLGATLGIAVVGGALTGMFMKKVLPGVNEETAFNDAGHFEVPDDYALA